MAKKKERVYAEPNRDEAWRIFTKYNKTDSLIKHGLAVEGVMRYFAPMYNGNIEFWGLIGLMHDLDYEMYPDQHCEMTKKILEEENWPPFYAFAMITHAWGICSDIEPMTEAEKVLYAIDELTGLITAAALVRPSKSVMDLTVKSVKKKWKSKNFAAGANREVIEKGAQRLGMELDELIAKTIEGMKTVAEEIGLKGK